MPLHMYQQLSPHPQVLFLKFADHMTVQLLYKCVHCAVVKVMSNMIGRHFAMSSVRCLNSEP